MRILNNKEFCKLPAGTVYSNYWLKGSNKSGEQEQLYLKGISLSHNDFLYTRILPDPIGEEINGVDIWEQGELDSSLEMKSEHLYERNGYYDGDDQYVVYTKNEVESMIKLLENSSNI